MGKRPNLEVRTGARAKRLVLEGRRCAGAELAPGPDVRDDDELLDYIRRTRSTVYHPACTVRMGADDDPSAPLDARLRVEGLRVADGSVMPDLVTVNPCVTTMAIGEKCADLIRAAC
ncbi:GMC oxidoreductase [Streptomyces sp. enrichment culture]|uniref:GMC oxidoreductase n=1 Tax=Streptomyces sp. enrichment culture TaxID=1795815 RepID=UPI003F5532D8